MLKSWGHPKKLRLGYYPYTYARVSVMKSLLLKRDDYHKMLKMSFGEIAKTLQDSSYKHEINALAAKYSGADLLELALNRNLAASFKKLVRIASPELALLIKEYIKRKDIEDLKTILRGKFTYATQEQITNSVTAAGTLSYDFLISLLKLDSVEEILKNNKLVEFSLLKPGLKELHEKKNLVSIENALDQCYYKSLLEFSKILPEEGALFRRFLLKEIEVLNVMTLLRLKRMKYDKTNLRDFIIPSGVTLTDVKILALSKLENLDEIFKYLEKTEYKDALARGYVEYQRSGSLIIAETELYRHLLKQTRLLLHQHPLSVDVILGYMFAKDIEIRNLRIIIKGKQLGLQEEFVESQLVN